MQSLATRFTPLISLLFLAMSASASYSDEHCEPQIDSYTYEVRFSFSFDDASLNSDSILTAQRLRVLRIDDKSKLIYPEKAIIDPMARTFDGLFCINEKVNNGSNIEIGYGLRVLKMQVVPVMWKEKDVVKDGKSAKAWLGAYPNKVHFHNMPTPDWLIPLEAYPAGEDGRYLILKFVNPSTASISDTRLALVASDGRFMRCISTSNVINVKLVASVASRNVKFASSDMAIGEIVNRDARISKGACGERDIEIDLGVLPAVAGKSEKWVKVELSAAEQSDADVQSDVKKMKTFGFKFAGRAFPPDISAQTELANPLVEMLKNRGTKK